MYRALTIFQTFILLGLFSIPVASIARAETSSGSLALRTTIAQTNFRELSSEGKHAELIQAYDELVRQQGSDATIGRSDRLLVAQSAWALGLVERARQLWDTILADKQLDAMERGRVSLARSILELQESNAEEARRIAQLAAARLEPSDLRSQLWLVIAEALSEQGAQSQAESYYQKAVDESTGNAQEEALYLLGKCQSKLGLTKDARITLVKIGRKAPYAADALRLLVDLDFQQRDFDAVLTWVEEGRRDFAEQFQDPWIYYVEVSSLLELGRGEQATQSLAQFQNRFSEAEPWYVLAAGASQSNRVQNLVPRARLASPLTRMSTDNNSSTEAR